VTIRITCRKRAQKSPPANRDSAIYSCDKCRTHNKKSREGHGSTFIGSNIRFGLGSRTGRRPRINCALLLNETTYVSALRGTSHHGNVVDLAVGVIIGAAFGIVYPALPPQSTPGVRTETRSLRRTTFCPARRLTAMQLRRVN